MKISELVKLLHIEGFTRPELVIDPYAHFLNDGQNGEIITYIQKIVEDCTKQLIKEDGGYFCKIFTDTLPWNSARLLKSCKLSKSYARIDNEVTNFVARTVTIDILFPLSCTKLVCDELFVKIFSEINNDYPIFPYEHRDSYKWFEEGHISLDVGIIYPLSMEGEYQKLPHYNPDIVYPDYSELFRRAAAEIEVTGKSLQLNGDGKTETGKSARSISCNLEYHINRFNTQNGLLFMAGYLDDRWGVQTNNGEWKYYVCGSEDEIEGVKYVLTGHPYSFSIRMGDYEEIDDELDNNRLRVLNHILMRGEINGDIIIRCAGKIETGVESENVYSNLSDDDIFDRIDEQSLQFKRIEYLPTNQKNAELITELNVLFDDLEYQGLENFELAKLFFNLPDFDDSNKVDCNIDNSENIENGNEIAFSFIIPKRSMNAKPSSLLICKDIEKKLAILNRKKANSELNGEFILYFTASIIGGNELECGELNSTDMDDFFDRINDDSTELEFHKIEYKPLSPTNEHSISGLNIVFDDLDVTDISNIEPQLSKLLDSFDPDPCDCEIHNYEKTDGGGEVDFSIIIHNQTGRIESNLNKVNYTKLVSDLYSEVTIRRENEGSVEQRCPSCGFALATFPKRKMTCPNCGAAIYPRTRLNEAKTPILLTEEELAKHDRRLRTKHTPDKISIIASILNSCQNGTYEPKSLNDRWELVRYQQYKPIIIMRGTEEEKDAIRDVLDFGYAIQPIPSGRQRVNYFLSIQHQWVLGLFPRKL